MIGRVWHGWATAENASAYERLFRERILPGLRCIDGFAGAYLLRRDAHGEVEIATVTLFDSMADVRAFAGTDPAAAHVTPEARRLLSRFQETVDHYDVVLGPRDTETGWRG